MLRKSLRPTFDSVASVEDVDAPHTPPDSTPGLISAGPYKSGTQAEPDRTYVNW